MKVNTTEDGEQKEKEFGDDEFKAIATTILEDYRSRKSCPKRKRKEEVWKEIDRQIDMVPDTTFKKALDIEWLPENELPAQAYTLEVLLTDVKRLLFPANGVWYKSFAVATDEYHKRVESEPLVAGDDNERLSLVNQEEANMVVTSWMDHVSQQFDLQGNVGLICGESIKYGDGIAKGRLVDRTIRTYDEKGNVHTLDVKIPMLIPMPLADTYLDEAAAKCNLEGVDISKSYIQREYMKYSSLKAAAKSGGGKEGWLVKSIDKSLKDDKNNVEIIVFHGDLFFESEDEDYILSDVNIWVVEGNKDGKKTQEVVRLRFNEGKVKIFHFPYHKEHIKSAYAASPLEKGRPLQKGANLMWDCTVAASVMNALPPFQFDSDSAEFANTDGPKLTPGKGIPTIDPIKLLQVGNPAALMGNYSSMSAQHADVTGTPASRLGQQTRSHTTAYAKDVEITKAQARTVEFVESVKRLPLREWLSFCYKLSLESLDVLDDKIIHVFSKETGNFINITRRVLPDNAMFAVLGSAGPSDDAARLGAQTNALQMAMNLEVMKLQTGQTDEPMNFTKLQKTFIKKAGIEDVDEYFDARTENVLGQAGQGSEVQGSDGSDYSNAVPLIVQNNDRAIFED